MVAARVTCGASMRQAGARAAVPTGPNAFATAHLLRGDRRVSVFLSLTAAIAVA
jgi:hypothetical protein